MITLDAALEMMLNSAVLKQTECIHFGEALHRVLAEDAYADMDMPPFDKSAVDGYACRREDIASELEIIETIAAGQKPLKVPGKNECSQIMTGAMLPEGSDCVIMVEKTVKAGENKIRCTDTNTKANISYKAEDIKEGDVVITKGTLLKAAHIAVLASIGITRPLVYETVKVGIISTGDELVEPDRKPSCSQIRNSNAWQLLAQCTAMGIKASYHGIAADNEEETYRMIMEGMEANDLLLLSGGISMGRYDFVPGIMQKAGIDILFKKIAVQPGRPTLYGTKGQKRVIGLPGNPVSSFIQFELLVKPLICKMMGHLYKAPFITLPLQNDYRRKRAEVMGWFPVRINEKSEIEPIEYHGSAHISSLLNADGLSCIEAGTTELKKGSLVYVRLL